MSLFTKRFTELAEEAKRVEASTHRVDGGIMGSHTFVGTELLSGWKLKVRNLLANACGKDSEHYLAFIAADSSSTTPSHFKQLKGNFNAAKEDYEGGYIIAGRLLVQAEVFSSELDQAQELLTKGYRTAAAVIAGVVLETHLQELSRKHGVSVGKIESMNAELAKKGIYNVLRQKQITAYADLRNKAAHGRSDDFDSEDVRTMIADIERFLAS